MNRDTFFLKDLEIIPFGNVVPTIATYQQFLLLV